MLGLLLGIGLLFALGALGLLKNVALRAGVRPVSLESGTLIASYANDADYSDAYEVQLEGGTFRDLDAVIDRAFQKGRKAARDASEIVYIDGAPGLTFAVSYRISEPVQPTHLIMTTTVTYTDSKGKWYFALVRPIHRTLVPFMLSRMAASQ